MYKYDGKVIYQHFDDQGVIEVVENQEIRSLHFGSESRQSSMILHAPNHLHSLYARTMMALLLFNDSPQDILMIGLGGGTLAKYFFHQFEQCQLQVVEFRRSVLSVAHSHFELPYHPRLNVKIGCGGEYVHKQSQSKAELHDLIVIDAFNENGIALEVSSENFFDSCRTLLKDNGILAMNLWGTEKEIFHMVAWNLGQVFKWKILFLPVRKRGNIIAFAFRENTPNYSMKQLKDKAKQLESIYHLEFPLFVKDIQRNNNKVLKQVIQS